MLQKHATRRHSAEVIWQLQNLFWMSLQLNPHKCECLNVQATNSFYG